MKQFIITHIVNVILTGILLAMVALPSLGGAFLVLEPPEVPVGTVAGLQTMPGAFVVEPNRSDFDDLVSFKPRMVSQWTFVDELRLTSFSDHLAIYNQLYRVRNTSSAPIKFRVRLMEVPSQSPFSQITAVSSTYDQPYFGTLVDQEQVGATLLDVDQPQLFSAGTSVLLGTELLGVLAKRGSVLVTTPIRRGYPMGERVYPQPLVWTPEKVLSWETQIVTLLPESWAYLTFLVRGEENVGYTTESASLKFSVDLLP
ncbi:hypothetical protein KJ608_04760 [Patescibacteria group bacterium]|nr:hypothetical protein [Patescibacteria group bacterium]